MDFQADGDHYQEIALTRGCETCHDRTKTGFVNPVSPLDFANRSGCVPERLETQHEPAPPIDRAMVLLHGVVQAPVRAHPSSARRWIIPLQQLHRTMTRNVCIQIDIARRRAGMARKCHTDIRTWDRQRLAQVKNFLETGSSAIITC